MNDEEQADFDALKIERNALSEELAAAKVEIATLTKQRDAYEKGMKAQTRQREEATEQIRKLKEGVKPTVIR